MCGRYLLDIDIENLEEIYRVVNRGQLDTLQGGMVFPSYSAPVIVGHEGGNRLGSMGWGYEVTGVKRPVINTRWERLVEDRGKGNLKGAKPSFFTEALRHRRCIIPATAYYEWRTTGGAKVPFTFWDQSQVLSMAGVYYRALDSTWRFAIVTRPPSAQVATIHDRMPLLLSQEESAQWLNRRNNEEPFYLWDLKGDGRRLEIKEGLWNPIREIDLSEPSKGAGSREGSSQLKFDF